MIVYCQKITCNTFIMADGMECVRSLPCNPSSRPSRFSNSFQRRPPISHYPVTASSLGKPPPQPPQPPQPSPPQSQQSRRYVLLTSVVAPLHVHMPETLETDARTVVNSILGAYGLPKIRNAQGFKQFDDFEEDYTFEYPAAWVRRKNTLRSGIYISDFNTADKLSVETLPLNLNSGGGGDEMLDEESFKMAVVNKLLNPGLEIGGDSRIEVPRASAVRQVNAATIDGKRYITYAFPSSTTTRSGYDVRRKNLAVVAVKESRNLAFILGVSVRSDEFNEEKRKLMQTIVESFRIR